MDKDHPDRVSEADLPVFAIRQGAEAARPSEDYHYRARLVIGQSERGYHYTVHDNDSRLEGEHVWVWSQAYDTEEAAEVASRVDAETSWLPLPKPREPVPQPDRRGWASDIGVSAKGFHYCLHSTDYGDPDFLAGKPLYSGEAYSSVEDASKAGRQWKENQAALEKALLQDDCRRALSAADTRAPLLAGQEGWERRAEEAASKGAASDHVEAMLAVERLGKALESEPASEEPGSQRLSALKSVAPSANGPRTAEGKGLSGGW
jgi:hypothetical protein